MNEYGNVKNYLIFSAEVLISATGIGFITRAGLGTSPISGIPFIMSLITEPSMGIYNFAFNMLFLLGEALIRRRFTLSQALQLPAALLFSLCIDLALAVIPTQYGGPYLNSLIFLAIGCVVMAFGIALEVKANVIMLPGEALVIGHIVKIFSRLLNQKRAETHLSPPCKAPLITPHLSCTTYTVSDCNIWTG